MTGFGRGEATVKGVSAVVELRGVNSRFLDVASRLPRSLSLRENDIKEILRRRVARGKINVSVTIERANNGEVGLAIDKAAVKAYLKLLNELKKVGKIRETITLDHLLRFSEVFEAKDASEGDEEEWEATCNALDKAIDQFIVMRAKEGAELKKDFTMRIAILEKTLGEIEQVSKEQVPHERTRLRERIKLLMDGEPADDGRLEQEIALLSDRLDVTEECVRFRSHNKFFLSALEEEAAGRKLNFLVQEMNREANTIGSKSNTVEIAHRVVRIKEELEKVREQLQNIE
jgi:uncharacterized protein (TIGR00255 family)